MRLQNFVQDQILSPAIVAAALYTTKSEIADTLGLAAGAFSRRSRVQAEQVQTRLRQMLEILNRVRERRTSFTPTWTESWSAVTPDHEQIDDD